MFQKTGHLPWYAADWMRLGEIGTIKTCHQHLPWPFSLAAGWKHGSKQRRAAQLLVSAVHGEAWKKPVTEEAGIPRCQAAKPRFSKAAARSYGTCVSRWVSFRSLSFQPFRQPSSRRRGLKNSFLLWRMIACKTGNGFLCPGWGIQ